MATLTKTLPHQKPNHPVSSPGTSPTDPSIPFPFGDSQYICHHHKAPLDPPRPECWSLLLPFDPLPVPPPRDLLPHQRPPLSKSHHETDCPHWIASAGRATTNSELVLREFVPSSNPLNLSPLVARSSSSVSTPIFPPTKPPWTYYCESRMTLSSSILSDPGCVFPLVVYYFAEITAILIGKMPQRDSGL